MQNLQKAGAAHFVGAAVLAAVAVAIFVALVFASGQAQKFIAEQKIRNIESAAQQEFAQDAAGGNTPQETWALFLDALQNKNFELAAKYFWVELGNASEQKKYSVAFLYLQNSGRMAQYIEELKTLHKELAQSGDTQYFSVYKKTLVGTRQIELESPVVFQQNPVTKVWKIKVLSME